MFCSESSPVTQTELFVYGWLVFVITALPSLAIYIASHNELGCNLTGEHGGRVQRFRRGM